MYDIYCIAWSRGRGLQQQQQLLVNKARSKGNQEKRTRNKPIRTVPPKTRQRREREREREKHIATKRKGKGRKEETRRREDTRKTRDKFILPNEI